MGRLRLRQRTSMTIMIVAALTLVLGVVGWWALHQTQRVAAETQTRTLEDISTAYGLAEQAAQIAAQAPYLGESALPFQLQSEREELDRRFAALDLQVEALSDAATQEGMRQRVEEIRQQLNQLIELVEQELFLREDLMVIRFELEDWSQRYLVASDSNETQALAALLTSFRNGLLLAPAPGSQSAATLDRMQADIEHQARVAGVPETAEAALQELLAEALRGMAAWRNIATRKNLLFASNRALSESLTQYVQDYAANVRNSLEAERLTLEEAVQRGRWGIIVVTALAFLALLVGFRFMFRMTRDLEGVTREMTRLAEGEDGPTQPLVERNDEIGELAQTFTLFREASLDRARVNRELIAQTQLLETVLNSINDGLSVFSADGRLLAWNARYLELFDLPARLVSRGMSLAEVQALTDRVQYKTYTLGHAELDPSVVEQQRPTQALTFERHFENGRVIEFRSEPMPGGGFVTLHSDLTDRRAIEQQLVQSQKMEMLGQLTGGVAHDFNNLLSALIGNLQLLEASPELAASERHYASRALSVAERGAHLVERLLAFSRKQQLHPERVEIGGLLEGMLDLVEYSVAPNVSVHLDVQDQGCQVWVDPSQLENAVLNLAINSSAAMPYGGDLWLGARQRRAGSGDPQVILEVRDSGTGMSEEVMNRIWEPFYTTKPVGQGSGLGLSLVYGFVKQSGGEVIIESEPGSGTCVQLYLPVHQGEKESQPQREEPSLRVMVPAARQVVLVEDDQSVRRMLQDAFRSLGISTRAFSSAEEAMQWISQAPEDVAAVLSDINLAGELSGVDLSRRLDEWAPHLPVILTSGLPREHLRQHFGLLETQSLLAKPVRLQQLEQLFHVN